MLKMHHFTMFYHSGIRQIVQNSQHLFIIEYSVVNNIENFKTAFNPISLAVFGSNELSSNIN